MATPSSPAWAQPLPAAYSPPGNNHMIGPIDVYPDTWAAGYGGVAAGGAIAGAVATPNGGYAPATGPSGGLANYLDSGAANSLLFVGGIAAALATAAFFLIGPEIAIAILALGLALDLGIAGAKQLFQAAENLAKKAGLSGIFGDITLAVVVGGVVYYVSHSRDGRVQIVEGHARHNPPRRRRRIKKVVPI